MKHKKGKLIGNIVCSVVLIVMVLMIAALLFGRAQNKVTFFFDRAMAWIMTDSMEDTIESRSYVLIKKATASEVQVGDVIMFYSDDPSLKGNLNTHRVMKIIGDHEEFVTQGDHNVMQDTYTAKADKIVGIYVKNLPVLTAIVRFFLTKAGFGIILAGFVILTAALYVPDYLRKLKKAKAESELEKEEQRKQIFEQELNRLKSEHTHNE